MNLRSLSVFATALVVFNVVFLSDMGPAFYMMIMFIASAAYFLRDNIRYESYFAPEGCY